MLGRHSLGKEYHWLCDIQSGIYSDDKHPVHIPRLSIASPSRRYPSQGQEPHALLTSLSTRFVFINTALGYYPLFQKALMAHLCLENKVQT